MTKKTSEIYEPREDSYLLKEYVEKFSVGKVLEIGTGSGILALTAVEMASVESVVAVDINPNSVKFVESSSKKLSSEVRKKFTVLRSDLFGSVTGKFDTIVFNPPYLPNDKRLKDVALDGGKNGYETIVRFLESANEYLTQPGIILLLFSSFSKREKIDEAIIDNCFTYSLVAEKNIDFETLYVYRIEKSSALRELEVNGVSYVHRFARGKRGLIFSGIYNGSKVTIKLKNPNSKSENAMEREYKMIDFLRNEGFTRIPKVVLTGHDFFVYEYIDGILIEDFLKKSKKSEIIEVIKNVFYSMRELDVIGVNKEEMHRPYKHILISNGDFTLIDFERCKETDKPQNVTQFCQYITSENFRRITSKKKLNFDKEEIIKLSQNYKKNYSQVSFSKILDHLEPRSN